MEMVDNAVQHMIKRRRIDSEDNLNTSDRLRQTKLFDLNADCLRDIFQYLDINDLVNLVEANITDYDDTEAEILARSSKSSSYEAAIQDHFMRIDNDDWFLTNDPACTWFSTRVFRFFRSLLSQITIRYYPQYQRHNTMMEQIILKYSVELLTEIVFDNADQCAFEDICKPFVNVKQLTFEGGYLSKTLGDVNKWFPKLESLILNETLYSDPKCIETRFLNLKLLSVKNKNLCQCHKNSWYDNVDADVYILTNENLKKFFELNPQLETLHIFQDKNERQKLWTASERSAHIIRINQELLIFLNVKIPTLRSLHLHMYETMFSHSFIDYEVMNFQNMTTLSIETSEVYRLCSEINIMSDQLVTLSLTGKFNYVDHEIIAEFVGRFKGINCLLIETPIEEVHDHHFVNMIKGLHNLISLNITLRESDLPNDAIFCMSQFEHLRVLQIRCSDMRLQHNQNILNSINRCGFMKENHWRGVIGYQWANFIFEKY